jgi:uncharacterized membrane protein (UPF0127 family)
MRAGICVASLVLVACGGSEARPANVAELAIHTSDGVVRLEVEVADEPAERSSGLMGRDRLDPYDGMAFVWDEPVRTSFWMKDTLIPLSIAFWDGRGEILAILDMEPCVADPCPTYDPGATFVGALEVARGRFENEGVEVGDRVEVDVPT